MDDISFWVISAVYVSLLAIVDGVFNRLIFRAHRTLPYDSLHKSKIYTLPEWRYIGVILLFILPAVLPLPISYALGGWPKVIEYLIILMLVQWDIIFGKIVFDDWWGDSPSIALPYFGWFSFPLKYIVLGRILVATVLAITLLYI